MSLFNLFLKIELYFKGSRTVFFFFNLFIWPCRVLVTACGIFCLCCVMQDILVAACKLLVAVCGI